MTDHDVSPADSGQRRQLGPPALTPCRSCPYRRDVPSGIWDASEYDKLPRYDEPTYDQPLALWQCHQTDRDHPASHLCAGWVGCHGDQLLALRLGLVAGEISPDTYRAAITYQSPTPLFDSGAQAAAHGRKHINRPNRLARRLITRILRRRTDLTH